MLTSPPVTHRDDLTTPGVRLTRIFITDLVYKIAKQNGVQYET